jgi:maltose alpha-D-glucosyltransferase/alpha-amylase
MTAAQTETEWWLRGNFYSLYIDRFAGDIPTLIAKLDYFVELGVDCLHLLPHYPTNHCDGGFDVIDHTGVRADLGTIDDFKRLCTEAHQRGLKIMVDLVLNHTSDAHPWFMEARQSKNNPKRDFYLWSETGTEHSYANVIFPDFKDSNWVWNEATQDYYYATFKPCQPELNWHNPAVHAEMFQVADTLVSYGVDAFRLDAIMKLVERDYTTSLNLPETHSYVKKLRAHLSHHQPAVVLLGEVLESTKISRTYLGEGDECHLAYNVELMNEMLYALVCGGRAERLQTVIEAAKRIPSGTAWLAFLRNHDSLSLTALDVVRAERLLHAIDPEKKYRFKHGTETTQRLYNILGADEAMVKEAFSMLYALPTATVMYYGDEIGMQNAPLPPGEDDMRYVSRGQFDWEKAAQQMADQKSLWHHVKKCMHRHQ